MDEVKRLLEQFADKAVLNAPPVDVDADVARGRRALRRIRARRRTAGVLCAAATIALIVAAGNPARWFAGGDPGVATDEPTPAATLPPTAATSGGPSLYMASAPPVVLVANHRAWPGLVQCKLVPAGWRQASARSGAVELAPPGLAAADASAKLVLRTAIEADRIDGVEAFRTGGRVVHLGRYPDGARAGQVKVSERWLIVRLPIGEPGWTDTTLHRLIESCTIL